MEAKYVADIMKKLDVLPYQKILFDGAWGIGKTKYVTQSIDEIENAYYISAFGKKNIESLYQELYYQFLSKHKKTEQIGFVK